MICIDNLETGSLQNIEHIRDGDFDFRHIDIIEHVDIPEDVDFVYHLASPASPIDYLRLPLHTLKVGSHGTHHMLGVAKFKRARFLLASTSEVYGDPQVHPQTEDYWGHVNPIGPRGVYDEAKRYAEAMTMAYHRQQGVDTSIVRIFNTYGPRMRAHDGRAIPTFLRQALEDRPLTVFGDGEQTRSFCYVDDLIRGIVALAESDVHSPVNIGNPNEFTLLELAKTVIEVTESRSEIIFEPLPDRRSAAAPPRHHPRPRPARLGAEDRAARGPADDDRASPASSASPALRTKRGEPETLVAARRRRWCCRRRSRWGRWSAPRASRRRVRIRRRLRRPAVAGEERFGAALVGGADRRLGEGAGQRGHAAAEVLLVPADPARPRRSRRSRSRRGS